MANTANYTTAERIFLKDLAKNIFNSEDWLAQCMDIGKKVKKIGNVIVWQESGVESDVYINNVSNALIADERADIQRTFTIDEYQTKPRKINWSEELLVNYEKRQDILDSQLKGIKKNVALRMLFNWFLAGSTNGRIVRTTGAANNSLAPGATGTRLSVAYKDITGMMKLILKSDVVPENGKMNILIPVDLQDEIANLTEFKSREFYPIGNTGSVPMMGMQQIGTIAGCNVFVRPTTLVANNAATPVLQSPKANDTAAFRPGAATDNYGVFMWHSDYVTKVFNENDSLVSLIKVHGGLELSVTALAGGSSMYSKGEGTAMLIQAP